MRVLVACEFTGEVRRAFRDIGHDAWSCDLVPAEDGDPHHLVGDALDWMDLGRPPDPKGPLGSGRYFFLPWDLMIAFPPCTHLASSGARWFKDKREEQPQAVEFFLALARSSVPRIAIENPVGVMSSIWRKPDQIIQPWQFGHGETKATCLWLKGLPHLVPTKIVAGREARIHRMPPSPERGRERSRTYSGIALAMAQQWGNADADLVTKMEAA